MTGLAPHATGRKPVVRGDLTVYRTVAKLLKAIRIHLKELR